MDQVDHREPEFHCYKLKRMSSVFQIDGEFQLESMQIEIPNSYETEESLTRKEFEANVAALWFDARAWIQYAQWEESHGEFNRSRDIFERAFNLHEKNDTVWLEYAQMEIRAKDAKRARNVLMRAVDLLPSNSIVWYQFVRMEEYLGGIKSCRAVFEAWMSREPDEQAWRCYISFELKRRHIDIEHVRALYERMIALHPLAYNWLRFARFEERNNQIIRARDIYIRAIEFLKDYYVPTEICIAYAEFEERHEEFYQARYIYRKTIKACKSENEEILAAYAEFKKRCPYKPVEMKYGVRVGKRKLAFE